MKIRCGTDIIEIDRIKENVDNLGEKFLNKVFTKNEIQYCESRKKQKYQHYAARFATKEATFKAISSKIKNKYSISWKDIEVVNDKTGRPHIYVQNIDNSEIEDIDISISHCEKYAIANVVILYKEG